MMKNAFYGIVCIPFLEKALDFSTAGKIIRLFSLLVLKFSYIYEEKKESRPVLMESEIKISTWKSAFVLFNLKVTRFLKNFIYLASRWQIPELWLTRNVMLH